MDLNDVKHELPSNYDLFFCDYWIIKKLDVMKFSKFINKYDRGMKECYLGYLYLLELVLIDVVVQLEYLISDDELYETMMFSENKTIEDEDFKSIINNYPEGKRIIVLNTIRKELSRIRYDEEMKENNRLHKIKSVHTSLLKELESINKELTETYEIILKDDNGDKSKKLILYHTLKFNQMYSRPTGEDIYDSKALWPSLPFTYLLPKNVLNSYSLRSNLIKPKSMLYLEAYKMPLLYLYKKLISERIEDFENDLLDVENWDDLHSVMQKINENIFVGKNKLSDLGIFELKKEELRTASKKSRIKDYNHLRKIFRDLRVKVLGDTIKTNPIYEKDFFLHMFLGSIMMSEYGFRRRPEIIEFKKIWDDKIGYSYAIYVPTVLPSPQWLIFDNICISYILKQETPLQPKLDRIKLFKEGKYIIHKYDVDGEMFCKYLEENDFSTHRDKHVKETLKSSKGLLSEFLAGLYLIREKKVSSVDIHRDITDTDIDAIGKTNESIFIVQVKPNLSINEKENKKILKHFEKVVENTDSGNKKIKKILFIVSEKLIREEIEKTINEAIEEKKEKDGFKQGLGSYAIDINEENIKKEIENYFINENDIDVVYWKCFREELQKDGRHDDLINKIENAFNYEKEIYLKFSKLSDSIRLDLFDDL